MAEFGIKGTIFSGVVDDVHAALEAGHVTRETLEAALTKQDLERLEEKVNATAWYDVFAYHRVCGVLAAADARDIQHFWFERGRRAARRLIGMGIYQQLDYLGRTESRHHTDPDARFQAFGRDMKLLMTLHKSMLNFGEWKCVPDPEHPARYRVEISGIADVPDGIFIAAAGTFTGFGEESRGETTWLFERPNPDLVLIRMQSDL